MGQRILAGAQLAFAGCVENPMLFFCAHFCPLSLSALSGAERNRKMKNSKRYDEEALNFMRTIGNKIFDRRTELDMKAMELAKRLDISYCQLSRYENGGVMMSAYMLARIAKELDKPISYFIGHQGEQEEMEELLQLLQKLPYGKRKRLLRLFLAMVKEAGKW